MTAAHDAQHPEASGLPEPSCFLGYPRSQVVEIVGLRLDAFDHWMRGQTVAICDGRRYDPDQRDYVPTACSAHPHGVVVYPWDVRQFLAGGGPLD